MEIVKQYPLIEQILTPWQGAIGATYVGYRGHVYRMFNCCLALVNQSPRPCSDDDLRKLAIAAAFHDLGLWSDQTVDYLPPSVERARQWLAENDLSDWSEEIGLMIAMHHKLRPYRDPRFPLVELFRKADLVDFSLGLFRGGLPSGFVKQLKAEIPNAGFHRFLLAGAKDWFLRHPFSPPPFMKW
ncbi:MULTISPECIES: hypothetical protein [Thiorhodovibrio]|uniref:hypothetical protein n=1 Tax=Thiorhodovibrio TaxID=61593 RepID=UPI00191269FC|nr:MULTISPECIES: hypothetical protein [Thiorhodovibrio]MBK5969314.1 hypothetical protein [Thiorhodovibrio winogradskyi]WPL11937.1 hypothetical protein Thiosp_01690 [Thiorhodovibrio litoralis]